MTSLKGCVRALVMSAAALASFSCTTESLEQSAQLGRSSSALTLPAPAMLKDINVVPPATPPSSAITRNFVLNGVAYFFATSDGNGSELFRSDGTLAGTRLVKDINPGAGSGAPSTPLFFDLGGVLIFTASDGASGTELWRSDGTSSGTSLLRDINPGSTSGVTTTTLSNFAVMGSKLYFPATDGTGSELWATDGTAAGTARVADIHPTSGSSPTNLVVFNNALYFLASDGVSGTELWKTDGATTTLVADINGTSTSSSVAEVTEHNGFLYFRASGATGGSELYRTDGVTTSLVKDINVTTSTASSTPGGFVRFNNELYFRATDGSSGIELWKTDGTDLGTVRVADLNPGSASSLTSSDPIIAFDGKLVFPATASTTIGKELYVFTGTGTPSLLADLNSSTGSSSFNDFFEFETAAGKRLFFTNFITASGRESYVTDGTPAGTFALGEINPGSGSSSAANFAAFGGKLFFSATSGTTAATATGSELYATDGTVAGTALVRDINQIPVSDTNPATRDASPQSLFVAGGRLNFRADDGVSGNELWTSDGTAAGTTLLKDIYGPASNSTPTKFTTVGETVFFIANDGVNGVELWKTGGTSASTTLVKDINPNVDGAGVGLGSSPDDLTAVGNLLYFTATDGASGRELWRSDGTEAGTYMVIDLDTAPNASGLGPSPTLRELNGLLTFKGWPATGGQELWITDGTAAGTRLVKDIDPSGDGFISGAVNFHGLLLFRGDDGVSGEEVWRSDGTEEGTFRLADVRAGSLSSFPSNFTVAGDKVFFTANDGRGTELWVTDGTTAGTELVRDLNVTTSSASSLPTALTAFNGFVFFRANDGVIGSALYKSDGTEEGTTLVKDIDPNTVTATNIDSFRAINGTLYFRATDGVSGFELWKTDGSEAGTVRVKDINAGSASGMGVADVVFALELERELLFAANDGEFGSELWSSDGTLAGTVRYSDIAGGADNAGPVLLARGGDFHVLSASDGINGREPWGFPTMRDITPPTLTCAATFEADAVSAQGARVFFPAPVATDNVSVPAPTVRFSHVRGAQFPLGTTQVTMTATDAIGLSSTPCVTAVTVSDLSGPTVTCPQSLTAEATSSTGAQVSFPSASAVDNVSESSNIAITYSRSSGETFSLGTTTVTVRATDEANNFSECTFDIDVDDSIGPALVCPAPQQVEAEDSTGALVTYPPASAEDAVSANSTVSYSKASGERFPLGVTSVLVQARDDAQNVSECSFPVDVRDTVAPTLVCPSAQVAEATSPAGAQVDYGSATATDSVTSAPFITYDVPTHSTFSLGNSSVLVTASDEANNASTCTVSITVQDTTKPTIVCPSVAVTEATHPNGASVSYADATASDAVTVSPALSYSRASGEVYGLGDTTVTATATDGANNAQTCDFVVSVRDTTKPTIVCPADQTFEASSAQGAFGDLVLATATDTVSEPLVRHSPAYGAQLPLGTTAVVAEATDGAGNTAQCQFNAIVVDTVAPNLSCPADATAEAASPAGSPVTFAAPTTSDAVTAMPTLTQSRNSGDTFALGVNSVQVTSSDGAGNVAQCSFSVTIVDTTPPTISCPQSVSVEAISSDGAQATFDAASASDTVSTPTVTYSRESGATFGLGMNPVTATARDGAGNTVTCDFQVLVVDTTAPVLTCPAAVTAEAVSSSGATVSYAAATATDAVSTPTLTYTQASGTVFKLGSTDVGVTATDAEGNSVSCGFPVVVADTTAPSILCPADLAVEAPDASGAEVSFDATATDAVSGEPTISYDRMRGSKFTVGESQVTATATDAAGNTATCAFKVTVTEKKAGPGGGEPTDPGTGTGCGCASTSTGGNGFWLFAFAGVLGVFGMRRRTRES